MTQHNRISIPPKSHSSPNFIQKNPSINSEDISQKSKKLVPISSSNIETISPKSTKLTSNSSSNNGTISPKSIKIISNSSSNNGENTYPKKERLYYSITQLLQYKANYTQLPTNCQIPEELVEKNVPNFLKKEKMVDSVEMYQRNIQSLLNKLTLDNFQSIAGKLRDAITTAMESSEDAQKFLSFVVEVIFEKAVREPRYVASYSQLCVYLSENFIQSASFKRQLLQKCQQEFESPPTINSQTSPGLEPEELQNRINTRNNGVPLFIGTLFLQGLITEKIIHHCLRTLLTPDENNLHKFAALLTLIGKTIDHPKAKNLINAYFVNIESFTKNPNLSMRIRFVLLDVVDLRKNLWVNKKQQIQVISTVGIKSDVIKQVNVQEGR